MATRYESPELAERAFYEAFSRTDADAMMSVWATRNDIVCVHPLGDVLVGRTAIGRSWQQIFASGSGVQIRREVHQEIVDGAVAVRVGYEFFDVPGQTQTAIVVTNLYRRSDADGWRMILHHASPPQAAATAPQASTNTTLH